MPKRHASSDSSASNHEDLRFNLSLDTSERFASNPILENRFYEDKTAKTANTEPNGLPDFLDRTIWHQIQF